MREYLPQTGQPASLGSRPCLSAVGSAHRIGPRLGQLAAMLLGVAAESNGLEGGGANPTVSELDSPRRSRHDCFIRCCRDVLFKIPAATHIAAGPRRRTNSVALPSRTQNPAVQSQSRLMDAVTPKHGLSLSTAHRSSTPPLNLTSPNITTARSSLAIELATDDVAVPQRVGVTRGPPRAFTSRLGRQIWKRSQCRQSQERRRHP